MKSFLTIVAAILAAILGFAAMVLFLNFALEASEKEDCGRWRGHAAQGFPVTVPEWCEGK
jgi:hypothetical protein